MTESAKRAQPASEKDPAVLRRVVLTSLMLAAYAPAAEAAPELSMAETRLVETRLGETSPLQMVIANDGSEPDRLLGAMSDQFTLIRLLNADGAPIEGLAIPAGESRRLGPDGDALLMLGEPIKALYEGRRATIALRFEKAGLVFVRTRAAARPSSGLTMVTGTRTVSSSAEPAEGFSQVEHDATN